MRCDQLAAMGAAHLDARRWRFEVMAMPREGQLRKQRLMTDQVRGAVVIFLKRAWKVLDPEHLANWRDAAKALAIDYVDARTTPQPAVEIDVHIAASGALERYLRAEHKDARVMRLDHHADPHLKRGSSGETLGLAYFGRESNRTLPASLLHLVQTPDYDGLIPPRDVQRSMMRSNMHYAVRHMEDASRRTSFKPFTKGFNAAAVGAHVLVNRQVDDATDWLGADYPFLIDDCQPDTIETAIDKARTTFGTPEWIDTLATMEIVRQAVHPRAITSQLEGILEIIAR
ncbi:MAG: hypothetical protein KJO30_08650 [Boseongicola sp.]|nr:hypothetical protein [Boseongicola sp.]